MSLRSLLVTSGLAILGACAASSPPVPGGFLSHHAELTPDLDGRSAARRSTLSIDPARVSVGELAWRAPDDAEIGEPERQALLRLLGDELRARLRELPPAPDGRAVVLRAAITQVEAVSPALNVASALLFVVPLDRGGASVEIEAIDAASGEQVAALRSSIVAPLTELKAHFGRLEPAQLALRKAASEFGRLLEPAPEALTQLVR